MQLVVNTTGSVAVVPAGINGSLNNIKPNGSLVSTRGLFSEKCPAMAKEKPKVEVISCEMGSAQGQDCKSYIVIK